MRRRLTPILASFLVPALVLAIGCGNSNINKAKRFQNDKNYEQAIQYYKLALEKDPDSNVARYGLIESYAQQLTAQRPEQVTPERVEAVMAEMEPVAQPLMSDPNIKRYISMIYQIVAKRYAEEGRDDKAAGAWAKVVEIDPAFAEANFNLGLALMRVGRFEESLPHFQKAVALNPYFSKGYQAIGDTLLQLDRSEEAIQQYQKALELNPDDASVHHSLGLAYFAGGNTDKAVSEYKKALEIEPGFSLAYRSLHDVYEKVGDKKSLKEIDKMWKEQTEAYLKRLRENQVTSTPSPSPNAGEAKTGS